ncbi:class I SAM-dependent methyltransferase [Candidatus Pacearchaeota archaeon]|nr:class I SAM-dependent methyltransferase [Candidatus Pacearchaeota archaeon]
MFEIKNCRICGSENLSFIISLGNQYVTGFIKSEKEQMKIPRVPLELVLCGECKVLQLKHNAPPESMWDEQYWYKSGISTTIKKDLKDIVEKSLKLIDLNENDIAVDIGCNDGTLLGFYTKGKLIGFEPSKNVAKEAKEKGFNVINNFFNAKNFKEEFVDKKAKIITAISMFYDLENPNEFLRDINEILDNDGLFVIQQNYLATMLEYNAFDNICHEHREYYSLSSLKNLLEKHNLEIFDAELNDINGGSIRTYIKKIGNEKINPFSESKSRINGIIEREQKIGLNTINPYLEFALRIDKIREDSMNFLEEEKSNGKKIWIYGASTRGNVILQYFGLNSNIIDFIADKNQDKWGKKTIGSLIPITSPEEMRKTNPDYLLVNTWHFFEEIKEQEKEYFEKGGILITALPKFRIVKK